MVTDRNMQQAPSSLSSPPFFSPSFPTLDFSFQSIGDRKYCHHLPGVTSRRTEAGIKMLSSGCHGEWLSHLFFFLILSKTGALFYNPFAKAWETLSSH